MNKRTIAATFVIVLVVIGIVVFVEKDNIFKVPSKTSNDDNEEPPTPPATPAKLEAPIILTITQLTYQVPFQVKLDISYIAGNTGYNIYRSITSFPTDATPDASNIRATTGAQSVKFSYTDTTNAGSYYYAVTAKDNVQEGFLSNQVSITISTTPPLSNDNLVNLDKRQVRIDENINSGFAPYSSLLNRLQNAPFTNDPNSDFHIDVDSYVFCCYQLNSITVTEMSYLFQISSSLFTCANSSRRIFYGLNEGKISTSVLFHAQGQWRLLYTFFNGYGNIYPADSIIKDFIKKAMAYA
jgi:hypothetical protein